MNGHSLFVAMIGVAGLVSPVMAAGAARPLAPSRPSLSRGATCEVTLLERPTAGDSEAAVRVQVNHRVMSLGGSRLPVERLRIFPGRGGSVLVALVHGDTEQHEPRGGDTLWRVPCRGGTDPEPLVRFEGADFGHAATDRSGRRLFYTGADGIFALDLRTAKSRRVTHAKLAFCTDHELTARDVVEEVTANGELRFDRGCGYEWQWHGQVMRARHPTAAKPVVEAVQPRRSVAVAVDAGGGIWLSDGSCADPATFNRLWHSTDQGRHWTTLPVKKDRSIPFVDQPVRYILTDRKNTRALVVLTLSCEHGGEHVEPAWIYASDDAGVSFRPIGVPPGIPNEHEAQPGFEHDPLFAVTAPEGSLADLLLYGERNDLTGEAVGRWRSHDGGRTWMSLPSVTLPFDKLPSPPTRAALGDSSVYIGPEGLMLRRAGKGRPVRIDPNR